MIWDDLLPVLYLPKNDSNLKFQYTLLPLHLLFISMIKINLKHCIIA